MLKRHAPVFSRICAALAAAHPKQDGHQSSGASVTHRMPQKAEFPRLHPPPPRKRSGLFARALAWVPGALWLAACSSSSSGLGFANDTFVEVSPQEFDGPECAAEGGELQLYTATLIDVTGYDIDDFDSLDFELPSSPPSPCHVSVRFGEVSGATFTSIAHSYVAEIAGYDQADLEPVAPGSPILEKDGEYVAPRWTGKCGVPDELPSGSVADAGAADAEGSDSDDSAPDGGSFLDEFYGPVQAVNGRTVRLRGCFLQEVSAQANAAPESGSEP